MDGSAPKAGFAAFLGCIANATLRDIALHWHSARGGKRMPAWRDIDPLALRAQLAIIWSWKYDRDRDCFIGRLAGEDINLLLGRSLRGVPMEDLYSGSAYDAVFERCKRVVSEPCFMRGYGRIFSALGRVGYGERIALPLSDSGRASGDGIIGATAYHPAQSDGPPEGARGESIAFFAID